MEYSEPKKDELYPNCVAMTWGDRDNLARLNEECCWGFKASDCLRFLADHMDAHWDAENGNDPLEAYRMMESIEWRLEDANFHTFNGFLASHDYASAINWIIKDYDELLGGNG